MTIKKYQQARLIVILFILLLFSTSFLLKLYLLSFIAVISGVLLASLVRSSNTSFIDERELSIQEKAANTTFLIFTSTLGISTILLLIPSRSGLSVFTNGEFLFLESLGVVFAYLSLSIVIVYSISHYVLAKKYGGKISD